MKMEQGMRVSGKFSLYLEYDVLVILLCLVIKTAKHAIFMDFLRMKKIRILAFFQPKTAK